MKLPLRLHFITEYYWSYFRGEPNKTCFDSYSTDIDNLAECTLAAKQLKLPFRGFTNDQDYPQDCFVNINGNPVVWYNIARSRETNINAKPICKVGTKILKD